MVVSTANLVPHDWRDVENVGGVFIVSSLCEMGEAGRRDDARAKRQLPRVSCDADGMATYAGHRSFRRFPCYTPASYLSLPVYSFFPVSPLRSSLKIHH